jgi:hypothetical protein
MKLLANLIQQLYINLVIQEAVNLQHIPGLHNALFHNPLFQKIHGRTPSFDRTIIPQIPPIVSLFSKKIRRGKYRGVSNQYLLQTHNPTFAVHSCSSSIFSQQEDNSELRGATPNFLPQLSHIPVWDWLPTTSPSVQISSLSRIIGYCPSATNTAFFRYTRISPVQGIAHCWLTCVIPVATPVPLRLIPTPWASIAAPGRFVLFEANNFATHVFLDGFRLPAAGHPEAAALTDRYPCRIKLKVPRASKHWFALFIELVIGLKQILSF